VLGIVCVCAGIRSLAPTLRWYVAGEEANTASTEAAIAARRPPNDNPLGVWAASGAILILF